MCDRTCNTTFPDTSTLQLNFFAIPGNRIRFMWKCRGFKFQTIPEIIDWFKQGDVETT